MSADYQLDDVTLDANGRLLHASFAVRNDSLDTWRASEGFGVGSKSGARVSEIRRKLLKALHDAGARIALGPDSPQVLSVPGFSIHREMAAMIAAEFTPFQVLQCGT